MSFYCLPIKEVFIQHGVIVCQGFCQSGESSCWYFLKGCFVCLVSDSSTVYNDPVVTVHISQSTFVLTIYDPLLNAFFEVTFISMVLDHLDWCPTLSSPINWIKSLVVCSKGLNVTSLSASEDVNTNQENRRDMENTSVCSEQLLQPPFARQAKAGKPF